MSEGKEQELLEGAEPAEESPQEEVEPRGKKPKGGTPESELRALEVVLLNPTPKYSRHTVVNSLRQCRNPR